MDIKYLLCEPVSTLTIKENQPKVDIINPWPANNHTLNMTNELGHSNSNSSGSPESIYSSLSSSSSTSSFYMDGPSTPSRSYSWTPLSHHPLSQSHRRRTTSDIGHVKHHMFVYNTVNRRTRSESTGSTQQTRTPWTPFEDELLRRGYNQGLSWAMISSTYLPHRSRGCCWGRFKTLQSKNLVDPNHMRYFKRPWKSIEFGQQQN